MTVDPPSAFRETSQELMPPARDVVPAGQYDIYPAFPVSTGLIQAGYPALAALITRKQTVVIDGYPGVLWENFQQRLDHALKDLGIQAQWTCVDEALVPASQIDQRIAPYLGGSDPLFGFRFSGQLADFYDPQRLAGLRPNPSAGLNIIYGTGAALAKWPGLLLYIDVPKNEIQFRARSKSIRNLGAGQALDPKSAYKRSYFIDWVAANQQKAALLPRMDWIIDEQRPDQPHFMPGGALRDGLARMARSVFRVRPWFEPGPWGGQWIKAHIPQLAQHVPNYAWSFELIVPENGLLFESGGLLLEVSFDMLMFQEYQAVLGESAPNFQYEFPIRFDFLDTFDGGNLSIQCHPRSDYIRKNFGETFTQDETYYILDAAPDARVYLGFQETADPIELKERLLESAQAGKTVDIDRYIYSLPVKKHDLLLIPNGTIHGAGKNNLVLEISATPYIFTFKMYDWLRLDMNGKFRPLNIERAFENLYFDRRGQKIEQEFISHQHVEAEGEEWRLIHCPTHPNHFFDVHRFEFCNTVGADTGGSCHVMSLVEGQTVILETESGWKQRFNYAETFVIPAATGHYRLSSENGEWIKVVKAFIKPGIQWMPGVVPDAEQARLEVRSPQSDFILGVDGGGTSTRAAIVDRNGKLVGMAQAGPSNYDDIGAAAAQQNIDDAIQQARITVGLGQQPFASVYFGMAGVVTEYDRSAIRQIARNLHVADANKIGVDHDCRIALAGGLSGRPGIVLITGTGSSCYGRNADGEEWLSGGWGYLLADEGSGYWLGLQALRTATGVHDGTLPYSALYDVVRSRLNLNELRELMHRLYVQGMSRSEIATFAPLVTESAQQGDGASIRILEQAGNVLAACVFSVAKRLRLTDNGCEILQIGGLVNAGDVYLQPLRSAIRKQVLGARFSSAELPPVLGACVLAMQALGIVIDQKITQTLKESWIP